MATYKILGQVDTTVLGATTEGTLYTVPALTQTVCSTFEVCNRTSSSATVRVALRPAADGATAGKHYAYYDLPIPPNDNFSATKGWTLAAGDKVQVYGSTTGLTFILTGQEQA